MGHPCILMAIVGHQYPQGCGPMHIILYTAVLGGSYNLPNLNRQQTTHKSNKHNNCDRIFQNFNFKFE